MTGALDPIQEDLPFGIPKPAEPEVGPTHAAEDPERPWERAAPPPGPSLLQQARTWLRARPWGSWRASATPVLARTTGQLSTAVRKRVDQAGSVARVAVTRGTPYTVKLARSTVSVGLVPGAVLWIARAIHALGLPAVTLRTAIQLTIVHRAGLAIDEVVFFRLDDPAGYTVYEAPPQLGLAAGIAFIPTLILAVLAVVCLAPALTPTTVLHLPVTGITWVQIWLGLGFAAHALPTYEEAGPLAEQARVGVVRANPGALLLLIPAQAVALVTRFGGLLPAVVGAAAIWLLTGALLTIF
jgi:hypothetical protein